MAKKKKKEKEIPEESSGIRMKEKHYWEWRTTIEELQHMETALRESELQYQTKLQEIEILKLKSNNFRAKVQAGSDLVDIKKKEYENYRKFLEKEYKITLHNAIINERMEIIHPEEN